MDTVNKLHANNLSCIRQQHVLFDKISFQLNAGEVLLIEGSNGSGKSSLLRLLTGLATPAAGEILWRGQAIQDLRADYWEHLHYIGHTNGLKPGLSVIENIELMARLTNSNEMAATVVNSILSMLQLEPHKNTAAKKLSAGQKRRIALAKLFLLPKTLWLLDEPLTALDTQTQTIFLSHLDSHLQNGGIAVISSHHELPNNRNLKKLRLTQSC